MIEKNKFLKALNKLCDKISNIKQKGFDSELPVYNEKQLNINIKSYGGKTNTNFHENGVTKGGSRQGCLSVILIDSVFQMGKNYYLLVFLEQHKYIVKNKMTKFINDELEISTDDSHNSVESDDV